MTRESQARYRKRNPEIYRKAQKKYYYSDKGTEVRKAWFNNPEIKAYRKEYYKEWREKNKEKIKELNKKYYQARKTKIKELENGKKEKEV